MGNNPSRDLYFAARSGDVRALEKAVAAGGDLNFKYDDKKAQTPLIAAAKHGHAAAVAWLLSRGALDFRTTDGNTAMHEAARFGHDRVVAALLDRGSDHFSRNAAGLRAVDKAAEAGHANCVRLI